MRPLFLFRAIGLAAVLLTVSCAPATPTVDSIPPAPVPTETSVPQPTAAADSIAPQPTDVPTQPVEVQAVATSRGPNLEATDPAMVSLASGQLQLVEFFRFT
jgi:hypothetical protein